MQKAVRDQYIEPYWKSFGSMEQLFIGEDLKWDSSSKLEEKLGSALQVYILLLLGRPHAKLKAASTKISNR